MTGYASSNGELEPEYQYLLQEARKAAAAYADDPVLKPFFDLVIEQELRDREKLKEDYQNRMLAMA